MLFSLAACLPVTRIGAFEGTDSARMDKEHLQSFVTPRAALKVGLDDFGLGRTASAIEALNYAAKAGDSLALWKLANVYANGDGVPRDDLKAYDYLSQIVANYDEDNPDRRDRAIVSSAYVELGMYDLNGIANSKMRPDPHRAIQMFQFAATTFGDANAQYQLALMHLDGAGVDKDGREGLKWLSLAADKGHLQAEAKLGQALFSGENGVQPQRARGLMWLTLAREAANDSKNDKWIIDLYDKAVASANAEDRRDALHYLEDHLKRRN
ncbi:MAG TPA: tetratricopeptide repeat protein [Methylocella sp.]|nr:tetratricopeptide repeat protein [Methylocella sp.]